MNRCRLCRVFGEEIRHQIVMLPTARAQSVVSSTIVPTEIFSARNIVRWKAAVLLPRTIFAALQQSIRFNKIIVSASLALARMPWRFNAWISR
jgi:hypothetical protein